MKVKSLVAGIVSAGFLGACVWGAAALVSAGVDFPDNAVFQSPASHSAVVADPGH
ncbi:hypothetical protein [Rhodococcus sp. NPDC003348]